MALRNHSPDSGVEMPVQSYRPNTAVRRVTKLRGGRAEELGLKRGDRRFYKRSTTFKHSFTDSAKIKPY